MELEAQIGDGLSCEAGLYTSQKIDSVDDSNGDECVERSESCSKLND